MTIEQAKIALNQYVSGMFGIVFGTLYVKNVTFLVFCLIAECIVKVCALKHESPILEILLTDFLSTYPTFFSLCVLSNFRVGDAILKHYSLWQAI